MFPLQELFIKICGITNLADAEIACSFGANAVGFVFKQSDQRYVSPERAASIISNLPEHISKIGVFENASPRYIQSILKKSTAQRRTNFWKYWARRPCGLRCKCH